ncbi:hypothetical protein ACHQM5_007527 [Ranunculus cassubicifolius]
MQDVQIISGISDILGEGSPWRWMVLFAINSRLYTVSRYSVRMESMVATGVGCKWDKEIKGCTQSPGILWMESIVATDGGCKWDKEIKGDF